MDARAIDDAARRLGELRQDEWSEYGLAGAAFVLAIVASAAYPAFAIPLLLAGVVGAARGTGAAWTRWDLIDELASEEDAHCIAAVRAHAARSATLGRRRQLAGSIRFALGSSDPSTAERAALAADELAELAGDLDDDRLELLPAAAAECERLVTDSLHSPLLNAGLPVDDVRPAVRRIRAGFHPIAENQPRGPARRELRPLRRWHV